MTEKELKKLNRYQLLELIIIQSEQIQELQEQLQQAQAQIDAQDIRITEAGSIAEASLQLSGIFEAAQAAADIYLENVRRQTADADSIRETARQEAARITAEAAQKAAQMTEDAESLLADAHVQAEEQLRRAQTTLEEAQKKSAQILEDAAAVCMEKERSINAYIASIQESFHNQFQSLDQILQRRAAQNEL